MKLEKFYPGDKISGKYNRPEDELETPEVVEVNKRERVFNAEGGFRNLLRLKFVVEDLGQENGFLRGAVMPDYIQQVIDDPKTYAYSTLGFDSQRKEIPDEELQSALKKFLEESKIPRAAEIDRYLSMIIDYESTTQSEAFKYFRIMIEDCKKSALNGDWESYCKQATKAKLYLQGLEHVVELCCGTGVENDGTRKVLDVKK